MKKIIIIVAMIFVTVMANAHVFLFQLRHEKFGNTNLIVDTEKQTIRWMAGIEDIVNIKYSKVCSDNPNANNRNMSNYEKAANMQYFFYSSNLPIPKSIKASLEDIVKGKYGEGCIITIKGVILVFKNEDKFLFVDLVRRDQNEYIKTFVEFMVKVSGLKESPKSPSTSSSTKSAPVYQKNWKTMRFNGFNVHKTMSPTKIGYLSNRNMINLNDVDKVMNCQTAILKCILISHNGINTNMESEITLGWSDDRKMLIAVGSLTGGYVGFMTEKYNVKTEDYLYDAGHRYRFTSSANNVSVVYASEVSTYLRSEHYIYVGDLNNPNKEDVYYVKSVSFPAAGIYNSYPCYDDDEGNLLRLFVTEVMYKRL
jgi:hypothetical protein